MKKNTCGKGDISEAAITLALLQKGYIISKPIGNQKYDLIADCNGTLLRVQCKTARRVGGCLVANAYTVNDKKRKAKKVKYTSADIDSFGLFDPETKKVYFIALSNIFGNSIRLRVKESKVKLKGPAIWASVYELRY